MSYIQLNLAYFEAISRKLTENILFGIKKILTQKEPKKY